MVNRLQAQALPMNLFDIPSQFEDRILVIISLNGGNDGLNTIIPIDQFDNLAIQRPHVLIPENQILTGTSEIGFHPAMQGISNMFANGKVSIVQSVGYPEQNRSHFRSMDIWTSGTKDVTENRGWLGRFFEQDHPLYPEGYPNSAFSDPFAISLGGSLSTTCQGNQGNFSALVNDPSKDYNLPEEEVINDGTLYGCNIDFVSTLIEQTNLYGQRINVAYDAGNSLSTKYYIGDNPQNDFKSKLAEQMKYVAQMIAGGMETKVYILNLNGFDTHGEQVEEDDTTIGEHADLLRELSDAVEAFQDDLEIMSLNRRVVGMTFSEFGRQIASNGSFGTDHGDAAPLLLFGDCISTPVVGVNPLIPDQIQNQRAVDLQFDFRDVYASILKDWFQVPENRITQIFPDHNITYLSLFEGCYNGLTDEDAPIILWPNPSSSVSYVDFYSPGGNTQVNLVDTRGRLIRNYLDKEIWEGRHKLELNLENISTGYYLVHIVNDTQTQSVSLSIR
jgi:uncharacterized protein (DUF1501 family)